jgi:hypothetical protein
MSTEIVDMYQIHIKRNRATKQILRKYIQEHFDNVWNERYLRMAINTFRKGYIYKDKHNIIRGFCIWKLCYDPPKSKLIKIADYYLHILLIHKNEDIESRLLNDMESYCQVHMVPQIRLEPFNKQEEHFYKARGYQSYKTIMIKEISLCSNEQQSVETNVEPLLNLSEHTEPGPR